jgi:predicted nucleic-acid-binding Zn-ribbon protein
MNMMKTCPECGSTEIISDLLVFADELVAGQLPLYVKMIEPGPEKKPFIWVPKGVASGFRAAVCGKCGFTHFYASNFAELVKAREQGYTSEQYGMNRMKV